MKWWNVGNTPIENKNFIKIIDGFVFNCPSTRKQIKNIGRLPNGKNKHNVLYVPVSARNNTFRNRNIEGSLLRTILADIKKSFKQNQSYIKVDNNNSVIKMTEDLILNSHCKDENFELIVFKPNDKYTETEIIFYFIRCALAHGAFEVKNNFSDPIYILESSNNDEVKARIRLKESTLLRYLEYSKMTADEVKLLRK